MRRDFSLNISGDVVSLELLACCNFGVTGISLDLLLSLSTLSKAGSTWVGGLLSVGLLLLSVTAVSVDTMLLVLSLGLPDVVVEFFSVVRVVQSLLTVSKADVPRLFVLLLFIILLLSVNSCSKWKIFEHALIGPVAVAC